MSARFSCVWRNFSMAASATVVAQRRLGGLHHRYEWAA
jgi:hypothetical protein